MTLVIKNLPANAGDAGLTLQYSCLENRMDRGAWRAALHRVAELDRTEAT